MTQVQMRVSAAIRRNSARRAPTGYGTCVVSRDGKKGDLTVVPSLLLQRTADRGLRSGCGRAH